MFEKEPRMTVSPTALLRTCAVALLAALSPLLAGAQAYPARPITFVYPFPPGGAAEGAIRLMFIEAAKTLGQPVVFENRPGGSGRFGISAVMAAPPDGYLIGGAASAAVLLPLTSPTFKAVAGKDYLPVSMVLDTYYLLSAHPALPFRNIQGLVSYAKANPGKLSFAGSEPGSVRHLFIERLKLSTGIDVVNIPYKGDQQSVPDRLSGRVDFSASTASTKPLIDSGRLVAIATTGATRMTLFPDVPTLIEAGIRGADMSTWLGVVAPPGTPAPVINKLHQSFKQALAVPEVAKAFRDAGLEAPVSSPDEFSQRIKADTESFAPLVKTLGIKSD